MPLSYKTIKKSDTPQCMIVVLHGLGCNKESMTSLGERFLEQIPEALIVIPDAPIKYELSPDIVEQAKADGLDVNNCRSWFDMDLLKMPLRLMFNRIQAITDLNRLIDQQAKEHGIEDDNICLWGFSQGGGIALYTAIKRRSPCAAVVCHSSPFIGFSRAASRPHTLMIMGEEDAAAFQKTPLPIRLLFSFERSLKRLRRRHVPVQGMLVPGLHHTTSAETIQTSIAFFKKRLAAR